MSEEYDRHDESAPDGADRSGADRSGADPTGETPGDAKAGERPGMDLESMDEDALRRLLRDSVRDIEPSSDALEHLRHAVPARRARRRQVVVGAAAAVLVSGAAVPAMLHADLGPGGDKPMHAAGHSRDHVPPEEQTRTGDAEYEPGGGGRQGGGPTGPRNRGVKSGAPTTGSSAGPYPSSSLGPVSPSCSRDQLGESSARQNVPDEQGRVYGSFRVVNTSDAPCTVDGDGIVLATAQGTAKSDHIQVVDHTDGDEATGLPTPVEALDEVVLEPDGAYVVKFAWIPREGGGPTGCQASTPPPGDGEDAERTDPGGAEPMTASGGSSGGGADIDGSSPSGSGAGGTTSGATGGTGETGGTDGGTGSGGGSGTGGGGDTGPAASVVLSHTPDVGEPAAADIVLENACAGTLYRTGVLPAA